MKEIRSKAIGRVIIYQGMFTPQYKTSRWSGWTYIVKPGFTAIYSQFNTLEEALDALKKSKVDGQIMWEGLLSEL
jgi:hypothetical protein